MSIPWLFLSCRFVSVSGLAPILLEQSVSALPQHLFSNSLTSIARKLLIPATAKLFEFACLNLGYRRSRHPKAN